VVTNSLGATDEPLAYAGYERYRADMLKIGVNIFEIAPVLTGRSGQFGDFGKTISRLHAKLAIVDDERFFVGSMNLDHRSAAVNTEVGLVIDSPELVRDYDKLMRTTDRVNIGYRLRLGPTGGACSGWNTTTPAATSCTKTSRASSSGCASRTGCCCPSWAKNCCNGGRRAPICHLQKPACALHFL
jgi:hypothetical protein